MTPDEALGVISDFHDSIRDLRPQAIFISSGELPHPSYKIKEALFNYGKYLVDEGFYVDIKKGMDNDQKTFEQVFNELDKRIKILQESYGLIDSLFVTDTERANEKYREYIRALREGTITNFRMPNPFGEPELVLQYLNFLDENWYSKTGKHLMNPESPLGTFIYKTLTDKLIQEGETTELLKLAESDLTRSVIYPGKPSQS